MTKSRYFDKNSNFSQTDHGNCEQRRGKANQEHHFNSKFNLKAEATCRTHRTKKDPACNKIQKFLTSCFTPPPTWQVENFIRLRAHLALEGAYPGIGGYSKAS